MPERVRSRFLVHWTGKDLDTRGDDARALYVQRCLATLESGLWLTPVTEWLIGGGAVYEFTVPMTCFTEIRLSSVVTHAARYGHLGFCFDRLFVLGSGGSPVLYTRPQRENRLMQRLAGLYSRLDGIESALVSSSFDVLTGHALRDVSEARDLVQQICAHVKIMGSPGTDDFVYFDEAEWRVAFHERWARGFNEPGSLVPSATRSLGEDWGRPKNIVPTGIDRPPFHLKFAADDLSMLIAPDDAIRRDIFGSSAFVAWQSTRATPLPILTFDECAQF